MARGVEFVDLEFGRIFAPCRQSDDSVVETWVPFGMPKLSKAFQSVTFVVWGPHPKTGQNIPLGSGVLIAVPGPPGPFTTHVYAVTAKHVADLASHIRVNTRDGKSRLVPADNAEWFFEPKSDDIAVLDVTDRITFATDDYAYILREKLISDEFIKNYDVSSGDEGFMLGLFSSLPGKEKNYPAARFGCLSILADAREPILQGNAVERPSHVFEMHSRPGHSGSPVFLYRTPATDIGQIGTFGWDLKVHGNLFWGLLGIHSRQFWESAETDKAEVYGGPQPIVEGDHVTMPSSMTIIVPAQRILELLKMPKLTDEREARESGKKKIAIRPEADVAEPASDNPNHKGDFMRLLNAAAKGRSPKGRT